MRSSHVVLALLVSVSAAASTQSDGLFGSRAVSVGFGGSSVSPDGSVRASVAEIDDDTVDGFPAVLRVQIGTRAMERKFTFGLNAQVLWHPERRQFAVTGSEGGAVGQFQTAVVTIDDGGLGWYDPTVLVERAFGHPVKCAWPEAPNVGAIAWLSERRLLVAAEIMPHSNCDSMGTFAAYELDVVARRLGRRHGQLEVKRRWPDALGAELRNAPDECIRHPRACFVPFNHPVR